MCLCFLTCWVRVIRAHRGTITYSFMVDQRAERDEHSSNRTAAAASHL